MDQLKSHQALHLGSVKLRFWLETLSGAIILYILFVFGAFLFDGTLTFLQFSKAFMGTAAILFGLSFAMSGFCYYFDFLDKKIFYRKYLGLVGYWFALMYSVSLMIVEPDRYFYGFFDNFYSADIILGLTGMAIFTFMALISNTWAMKKMGPQLWRKSLRLGYFAWSLLALRAAIIEKELWIAWFQALEGFPPPRLLFSLFVIAVILFRISIEISKYYKRKKMNTAGEIT